MSKLVKCLSKVLFRSKPNDKQHESFIPENYKLLRMSLSWPGNLTATYQDLILTIVSFLFPFTLMILPNMAYLFFRTASKVEALDISCQLMSTLIVTLKQILCIYKRKRLRELLNRLQTDWGQYKDIWMDNDSATVLKETQTFCRHAGFCYGIWFGILCISYSVLPILHHIYFIIFDSFPTNYSIELPFKVM